MARSRRASRIVAATMAASVLGYGAVALADHLEGPADRLFHALDANDDGRIQRDEVAAQANLFVGALFFRADADGDGVVSPDEERALAESMPELTRAVRAMSQQLATGEELDAFENRIGVRWGAPLTASEARDATERVIGEFFLATDTNKDDSLSADELSAQLMKMTLGLTAAAFEAADADRNGALSLEEFQAALMTPAQSAFRAADLNKDGALSQEEARAAAQNLANLLSLGKGGAEGHR